MTRALSDTIAIGDADGTSGIKLYPLLAWEEEAVSDDNMPPGKPVIHKKRFWGGGMGERQNMGRGGVYYSENAYHGDPFALKPRSTIATLTLTNNTVPVERFFEATDGTNWYLYSLAGAKSFKIKTITGTPTLAETKTFSTTTIFDQGTYTGDGNDNKAITDCAFQPAFVFIKGDSTEVPVACTADMPAGKSEEWGTSTALVADGIKSLTGTGFTVGTSDHVNKNGDTYYWYAWKAEAGAVATGTYTGDAADDRDITGAGFKPAFVAIFGDAPGVNPVRFSTFTTADWAVGLAQGGTGWADLIQTFNNDGFQVGTTDQANKAATEFYWVALRALTGRLVIGTYDGDGQDGRPITGVGFSPALVIVKEEGVESLGSTRYGAHRGSNHSGDSSSTFRNIADAANRIESIDSDGFTVGSDNMVNKDGGTYHYICIGAGGTPQVGKPTKWPDKWLVPGGDNADCQKLTTVHNEGGAGDDTWTELYGLGARHFSRRGNKLARATKRHVSLCSADDVTNPDNWGAEYGGLAEVAMAAPDMEITDLVEWGQELAVCHTGGMVMFDGVATSREQLPLLNGLTDDDNGKNTLRMASFIYYPSADGLWRWRYGQHRRVDPDADPYYGPAEETSGEPVNLKYYGSAFCGDHVYLAAFDGTNYHLMHGRLLNEEGDIRFDCLLASSTTVIKVPYVDRNRFLWFGYGNNLAYIKLSQGGEPDGGNFGNASLVTTIYEPEIILEDDADVSLRMFKVVVRNMDDGGANTYKWELHVSRDGAAFDAQLGTDIQGAAMDGVQKRYWDPTSNIRARRLRPKIVGTSTAGYTPTTSAPEIIEYEIHGIAKPDDAEVIKVVINLEPKDLPQRKPATVYDELKTRENAGVVVVRHPILDTMMSMEIYKCDLDFVRQKGYEDPIGVVILWLRHGDTS